MLDRHDYGYYDDEESMVSKEGAPDIALRAPSLLTLSAAVLAKYHATLIQENEGKEPAKDVYGHCHLPSGAAHAIFDEHRKMWSNNINKDKSDVSVLKNFTDSSRFPMLQLDLTGATLNDETLADLLLSHGNVSKIDLTDVKGISDQANVLLDAKNVQLPQLSILRLSSMDLLRRPLPRSSRKNGVALVNIPVLGEEDLITQGGNDRLDQMREARGQSSNNQTGNNSYFFQHLGIAQQPNQQGYEMVFHNDLHQMERSYQSPYPSPEVWPQPLIEEDPPEEERELPVFTSRCPGVTSLILPKLKRYPEDEEDSVNDFLNRVLEPIENLQKLDISYWSKVDDLRCLNRLNLTTLILYEVPDLYKAIDNIVMLKELRYLDLSQSTKDTGTYPKPVTALHKIVTGLPQLEKLDISSTNLASQPTIHDWPVAPEEMQGFVKSDIVGLRFLSKRLKFLGLFNCDNASHFLEIPADTIAGDANEEQVITALQVYRERAGLLQSVLNESYQLYRFGHATPLTRQAEALHLVLEAMQRHLEDSTLQIAGSASLFYIIRKVQMNRDTKKQVVSALLCGMERHMEEQVMVRNCCLSLCQFEIPQEILFDYSRLAIILVNVLQHHNADQLTQRIVVFLLNSMACHVEGDQKLQIGSFGAIEMILDQIKRKLGANVCDDVMEVGWSFLWNITDETPTNCCRFLEADGLSLFQKCYSTFSAEKELVRNMMGLIGNIAEVDHLRYRLMNGDYVKIFVALLEAKIEDSIEISYNSAGVLAHMVSDGADAWKGITVCRDEVMEKIIDATRDWKLETRRYINYRSFRPILRLLPLWHAPASQHWAVWALANLTTTDGQKYCFYVTEEGGIPLLRNLVDDKRTHIRTKELAAKVLHNIQVYEDKLNGKDDVIMEDVSTSPAEITAV